VGGRAIRDGRATVAGWAEIATKDSSVKTQLRSVDLVALQAYLIKADETGVRKGTLNLDLESDVSKNRLKAPGKVITRFHLRAGRVWKVELLQLPS
jgi:hypothetical protein